MSEEEKEIINNLVKEVKTLKNKVEGQRLEIDKLNKIARHVDMIKLSTISKGQSYESNV